MTTSFDLAVIGAGPAGMAAANAAAGHGAHVLVIDDQPAPGGQIWRSVEAVATRGDIRLFGADYAKGRAAVRRFRDADVPYLPETRVVGVEALDNGEGCDLLCVANGRAFRHRAHRLLVATGAYERPTPFPGWTLPGVMTVGAAQTALKASNLAPKHPFVLAGQGPLLLLFAAQLRRAGIRPDTILLLDDPANQRAARRETVRAIPIAPDALAKGAAWAARLQGGAGRVVRHVTALAAEGDDHLARVSWGTGDGQTGAADASGLFVHDGVIPNAQLLRALRVPIAYDRSAAAWKPTADPATGRIDGTNWLYAAGDCAGIAGWQAASAKGAAAATAALTDASGSTSRLNRIRLARARALRPLLERLYPPARAFAEIADDVVICRCEEATAGDIRQAAKLGAQGPNQLKAFSRAGMGPCQGRMCAMTAAAILAETQGRDVADIGLIRTRMPISPITVGEMAGLNDSGISLPRT